MTKHLFKSRTFWLNVLGAAATIGEVLPMKYAAPTLAIANIGMRLLTNQGVSLLPARNNDRRIPRGGWKH